MKYLIFAAALFVTACTTRGGVRLGELDIPIVELQRAVESSLPLGKRKQSQNSREFFSEYFVMKRGEYEEGGHASVRYFAHILILGDRKPYNVDVVVEVEQRRDDGSYTRTDYDEGLARMISRRIQSSLHKRRDHLNIIDDFRVF
jgi:hypothetical protein